MRATEFIVEGVSEGLLEAREGTMREIIRKILPTWPEYVIKDWISSRIKNQEDLKNLTGWLVDLNKMVEPNSWKLHQKMFLTFDMLNPRTRYSMKTKRQFGARNPFLIPRDEERNANAEQLVKTKGMENLPPVTMIQHSNGLELCEGWHRTMAAFRLHPEGFYVNVWIGQAGQQGVAEGLEHADKLSGLVDLPVFPSSTNPRGTAKVVNTGDRIMAVLNVRGVNIPYYISTGGGGKASVPTGKWYPIFGRHSSGWLNKGGEDSINKSYGSNALALGSSRLNNMLGDLSSMESQIPFMKKSGDAIINRDLQPMSYSEVSANPDEFKKRVNSFLAKLGSSPFYKVNATETQGVAEGFSNDMSTEDMIAYLRQHHDTNLHQDYLNHVNTFSKFVLKDIPTNTLKTDLPGLDREKVERYKKMDQSKAPPIVLGGKYILDGYHRANAVKELGIPTIKAYIGIPSK